MKQVLFFWFLAMSFFARAQINAYARVTGIGGTNISVSQVNQTFGTFVPGDQVIIIQMQGVLIGTTGNNSNFGNVSSLNSTGLYEVATIASINLGSGNITLAGALSNNYQTSNYVQIVSYPRLGVAGYTTASVMTALPWNGSIGGIIAFQVNGNLTLKHNILADGAGFRGGAKAGNIDGPCDDDVFRTSSGNPRYADKGESVYLTQSWQRAGRGRSANGGGGGIVHNGGGGGGGNYTPGGNGYYGFDGEGCGPFENAGGLGGMALNSSAARVFMGGGGGGAHENNSAASDGANGGGVIFISADSIIVNAMFPHLRISANGNTAANTTGHDGAGGGGGGGSIVIDVQGTRVATGNILTISANGGDGGDVVHPDQHGSGGGGGQGTVMISSPGPWQRTDVLTMNGTGGLAHSGVDAPRAGTGGGKNNEGVRWGIASVLPVELIDFAVSETHSGEANVVWETATEKNSAYFELHHMTGNHEWSVVASVPAAGNSLNRLSYSVIHREAVAGRINYYRLKQVDRDGTATFSDIIYFYFRDHRLEVRVFPNPATGQIAVTSFYDLSDQHFRVISATGAVMNVHIYDNGANLYRIDLTQLPSGIYTLQSALVRKNFVKR